MRVREATDADVDPIVALWDEAGMLSYTPRPHDELARLRERDPGLVLVAEADETVTGTILAPFDGRRGWLMRLAVAAHARRQGVGRALVRAAEQRLRDRGCPQVNLLVLAENAAAQAFWERLGYHTPAPVVLMSRRLDDTPDDGGEAERQPRDDAGGAGPTNAC